MIKKEDVIKMIDEWLERIDDDEDAIECVLLMLKNRVENMPEAVVRGRWIPCSERLPEEDVDVLLCVNDEYDNAYFTVAYHHIVWQTEVGGMYGEVVAWMPLPEPYREE